MVSWMAIEFIGWFFIEETQKVTLFNKLNKLCIQYDELNKIDIITSIFSTNWKMQLARYFHMYNFTVGSAVSVAPGGFRGASLRSRLGYSQAAPDFPPSTVIWWIIMSL